MTTRRRHRGNDAWADADSGDSEEERKQFVLDRQEARQTLEEQIEMAKGLRQLETGQFVRKTIPSPEPTVDDEEGPFLALGEHEAPKIRTVGVIPPWGADSTASEVGINVQNHHQFSRILATVQDDSGVKDGRLVISLLTLDMAPNDRRRYKEGTTIRQMLQKTAHPGDESSIDKALQSIKPPRDEDRITVQLIFQQYHINRNGNKCNCDMNWLEPTQEFINERTPRPGQSPAAAIRQVDKMLEEFIPVLIPVTDTNSDSRDRMHLHRCTRVNGFNTYGTTHICAQSCRHMMGVPLDQVTHLLGIPIQEGKAIIEHIARKRRVQWQCIAPLSVSSDPKREDSSIIVPIDIFIDLINPMGDLFGIKVATMSQVFSCVEPYTATMTVPSRARVTVARSKMDFAIAEREDIRTNVAGLILDHRNDYENIRHAYQTTADVIEHMNDRVMQQGSQIRSLVAVTSELAQQNTLLQEVVSFLLQATETGPERFSRERLEQMFPCLPPASRFLEHSKLFGARSDQFFAEILKKRGIDVSRPEEVAELAESSVQDKVLLANPDDHKADRVQETRDTLNAFVGRKTAFEMSNTERATLDAEEAKLHRRPFEDSFVPPPEPETTELDEALKGHLHLRQEIQDTIDPVTGKIIPTDPATVAPMPDPPEPEPALPYEQAMRVFVEEQWNPVNMEDAGSIYVSSERGTKRKRGDVQLTAREKEYLYQRLNVGMGLDTDPVQPIKGAQRTYAGMSAYEMATGAMELPDLDGEILSLGMTPSTILLSPEMSDADEISSTTTERSDNDDDDDTQSNTESDSDDDGAESETNKRRRVSHATMCKLPSEFACYQFQAKSGFSRETLHAIRFTSLKDQPHLASQ